MNTCSVKVLSSVLATALICFLFFYPKDVSNSVKEKNNDKPYCSVDIISGVSANKRENIIVGETISIEACLQPYYQSKLDNYDSIPDIVLHEFYVEDSSLLWVDSIKYCDLKSLEYIPKRNGRVDLFRLYKYE